MPLTGSGQISIGDIAGEFGGSAPHALSEYYDKGNAPSSGEIQVAADFYGTSDAQFMVATGGTISTSGDYKYHKFTGNGTFTVTSAGNAAGSNSVEYVVVAGGGGGGGRLGGGAGAGGLAYHTGKTITATGYSISIGGGGGPRNYGGGQSAGSAGSNSSFHSSTANGGGGGKSYTDAPYSLSLIHI